MILVSVVYVVMWFLRFAAYIDMINTMAKRERALYDEIVVFVAMFSDERRMTNELTVAWLISSMNLNFGVEM